MKVIFLDCDGVINNGGQTQEMREFLMTVPVLTFGNLYQASVWLERNA